MQKDSHTVYLEQELESLKVVLEMKNNQLHQKEKKLMEMDKLVGVTLAHIKPSWRVRAPLWSKFCLSSVLGKQQHDYLLRVKCSVEGIELSTKPIFGAAGGD